MGTFFLFKDIFLSVVDMSIGNMSILHLRTNFFKVFLLNFFKKKKLSIKKKYKTPSDFLCCLISFPSFIKLRCSVYYSCLFKKNNRMEFLYKAKTKVFSTDCFFIIMDIFKVIQVGFFKKNTIQKFYHYLPEKNKNGLFVNWNEIQYNLLYFQIQLFFIRELLNKLCSI